MISNSRVIARGRGVREAERLVNDYGGRASMWLKKSSQPFDVNGELLEYHWYEQNGIGRFEIKLKKIGKT